MDFKTTKTLIKKKTNKLVKITSLDRGQTNSLKTTL